MSKSHSGGAFQFVFLLICAFLILMFMATGGCKVYQPVEPMRSLEIVGYPNTIKIVAHMQHKIDFSYYPDLDTIIIKRRGRYYSTPDLQVIANRTLNQFTTITNASNSQPIQQPSN